MPSPNVRVRLDNGGVLASEQTVPRVGITPLASLPNVLIVMFVLMLAYDFVTRRTTVGRRIYALGGNAKAARLSGIKTERLAFLTFVNMGVLSALAGLVFVTFAVGRKLGLDLTLP